MSNHAEQSIPNLRNRLSRSLRLTRIFGEAVTKQPTFDPTLDSYELVQRTSDTSLQAYEAYDTRSNSFCRERLIVCIAYAIAAVEAIDEEK